MNSCPACLNETNPGTQCPTGRQNLPYFAQIVINHNLIIPEEKPDVELISNVTKDFKIEDVEAIDVDLGDTTGRKLIISGTLTLGIEYSALEPAQSVHYAHFDIPFEAIVKARPCPGENRGLLPPDFNIADFNIRICVEHEQYHLVSPREISKVLVVLIWLEPVASTVLTVTKVASADTVAVGSPVLYTITVTNTGTNTAYGVTLVDTVVGDVIISPVVPACSPVGNVITCNFGNIPAGEVRGVAIEVTPQGGTDIVDTVTVQGINTNSASAQVITTVTP